MENIKKEEIEKLAELSRISMSEEELGSFKDEIGSILDYVKQVQEVTSGSESENDRPEGVFSLIKNNMREDKDSHDGAEFSKDVLEGSPKKEGSYFKVKKIL